MRSPFILDGGPLTVSASAGIAFHKGPAEIAPRDLAAAADGALYCVKAAGRDGLRVAA
jgi:GGDEF domain-containing protein